MYIRICTDRHTRVTRRVLKLMLKERSFFPISLGVSPSNRLATPTTPAFPRNVPSRSTFHSGQNRAQRNHTQVRKFWIFFVIRLSFSKVLISM